MATSPPPISGPSSPQDAGPVFVDPSGRRLRRSRFLITSAALAVLAFLALIIGAFVTTPGVTAPFFATQQKPSPSPSSAAPLSPASTPETGAGGTSDAGQDQVVRTGVTGAAPAAPAGANGPVQVPALAPAPGPAPAASPSPARVARGQSGSAPGATNRPVNPGHR